MSEAPSMAQTLARLLQQTPYERELETAEHARWFLDESRSWFERSACFLLVWHRRSGLDRPQG